MKRTFRLLPIGLLVVLLALASASGAQAAPPDGKGNNGNGNGNGNENANGNQGNGAERRTEASGQANRSNTAASASEQAAENKAERAAQQTGSASAGRAADATSASEHRVERLHPHQDRRTLDLTDRSQGHAAERATGRRLAQATAHGHGAEHGLRGREAAQAHVESLLTSLNKFEHARWDANPKDPRGQGNMGKVTMRDPYGFDKDSGREKSERGRPIREIEEPVFNLAELATITFLDPYLLYLQTTLSWYQTMASLYPTNSFYSWYASRLAMQLASYSTDSYYSYWLAVNRNDPISYTLTLGDIPESFEGDTLLVTTTLTSVNDYTSGVWIYDRSTGKWQYVSVHYDAGQTMLSQTQEVTLSDDGTFTYSYDPPTSLIGSSWMYAELTVILTEPESGATYTITSDEQLYLYRCPYGIVYDKTTGKAIAGATVTIRNADGSIALLDKAANPNASNPQTTDATGRYNAKLAIGQKYYLTVHAPGYADYTSPLFSERWHIVREDVGLAPLASENPQAPSRAVSVSSPEIPPGGSAVPPVIGIGPGVPVVK